jgi:hypothetical protein
LIAALLMPALLQILSCGSSGDKSGRLDDVGPRDSLVIELAGVDSTSVLDLLERAHEVEVRGTVTGTFVTAIDSVPARDGYFWVYSVNDSMAAVACDEYVTTAGDRVKWHYRNMAR